MTDKFEQKAREICDQFGGMRVEETFAPTLASALRAAHDEAVERATAVSEAYEDGQDKAVRARLITRAIRALKHTKESA